MAGLAPTLGRIEVEERMIPSRGVELFTRVVGPKTAETTVLVLHGGPGHSHDYLRGIEGLASHRRRVVLFDQRGAGRSSAPRLSHGKGIDLRQTAWSVEAFLDDIEAVRTHLGVERMHVVGFSWGGILGMAYAIHRRPHVASLVLVGTGEPGPSLGAARREAYERRLKELREQGLIPRKAPKDCTAQIASKLPMFFADPHHAAIAKPTGSVCTHGAALASWNGIGELDLTPALARITAPTLLFHGAQDYVSSPRVAEEIHRRMRASRLVIQERCGHRVLDECPQALVDAMLALWSEPPHSVRLERPRVDTKLYEQRKARAAELEREFRSARTADRL